MDFKDYYKALGVDRKATPAEIKTAYRKLARVLKVDITWIETLHAHGAISQTARNTVTTMTRLRKARRLEVDLGLNIESLAVVLDLLDQIDQLHGELERHRPQSGK